MIVTKVCYFCRKCMMPYEFCEEYKKNSLCEKCNSPMDYWETFDFDTETNKVVKRWKDPVRINYIVPPKPVTVTCPYCNSTNTKKISLTSKAVNTAMFGILGTKRHKQWHCNNCGSDW